ncbi:hypothetical protein BD309DRAFT_43612 [Dichomitus squalens]|uniref:Uncharacterized protein n=1 Tax=Dichomitus squalens TaxID=114155 RepID=A0A4Q9QEI1_9APHY|nr:hypothetical protein BD309DRAFT_43612 [Dichomitus squalens]TBU65204.1 hypothetical protein BD310DRAFT_914253 [Dichomitus squalens]
MTAGYTHQTALYPPRHHSSTTDNTVSIPRYRHSLLPRSVPHAPRKITMSQQDTEQNAINTPAFPPNPSLTSVATTATTTTITSTTPLHSASSSQRQLPVQKDYSQAFGALQSQYGWGPATSVSTVNKLSKEEKEKREREKRDKKERKEQEKREKKERKEQERRDKKKQKEEAHSTGQTGTEAGGSQDPEGVFETSSAN